MCVGVVNVKPLPQPLHGGISPGNAAQIFAKKGQRNLWSTQSKNPSHDLPAVTTGPPGKALWDAHCESEVGSSGWHPLASRHKVRFRSWCSWEPDPGPQAKKQWLEKPGGKGWPTSGKRFPLSQARRSCWGENQDLGPRGVKQQCHGCYRDRKTRHFQASPRPIWQPSWQVL